jgi:dTMP kinase
MFVSLDGIDGSGKSTQRERLCQWLAEAGYQVRHFRDPGSTPLGESVREILLHRDDIPLATTTEMLLYMAARAQLVADGIRPALAQGHVVVSDRYLLANVVYQGCAGGLDTESIWSIGHVATGGLRPDVTIVLDVPVQLARSRLSPQPDRLEKRDEKYFEKVRQGFLEQAHRASPRFAVLDATASIESIQRQIRELCQRHLDDR